MNWSELIRELQALGWRQTEIAQRCKASQGHISDLAQGHKTNPSFALGASLIALKKIKPPKVAMREVA